MMVIYKLFALTFSLLGLLLACAAVAGATDTPAHLRTLSAIFIVGGVILSAIIRSGS